MLRNFIPVLSLFSAVLFASYVALISATVFFASVENDFSTKARELESRIASLETEYFSALEDLSAADLSAAGFSDPSRVTYIAENGGNALTRADQ